MVDVLYLVGLSLGFVPGLLLIFTGLVGVACLVWVCLALFCCFCFKVDGLRFAFGVFGLYVGCFVKRVVACLWFLWFRRFREFRVWVFII